MGDELGLDLERLLRQRGWMRALARGLVSEGEVDDLVQESWLAALTAHSLPRSSVRAWFAGLARNAARGLRRVRDGEERECDALADGSAASSELLARAELQERLIAAVRSLREPERSTVLLCYFEELPLAEVARRMGVPGSTARTRHARALAELRERIGRERGDAWGLVVALARGGAPGITTTAMEATLMGMLAKVTVVAVAAAGIALVVWTKLEVPEERARVVHEAPPAPLLAESPRSETPAVEAHAEVEPRVPADSPADAKHDDPPAPPAPAPSIAASPLERRLEQVADSFLTEDPDVAGLVALSDALAGAVSVLPDSLEVHESGSVSGKFEAIGNLQGTFSCRSGRAAPEYSVELGSWNTGVPFPRVLRLEFSEEDGAVGDARILLTSHPMKEASPSLGGQEWTGWRVEIDGDGARAHRTSMRIDDPAPSADHYLYEIGDVRDVEPQDALDHDRSPRSLADSPSRLASALSSRSAAGPSSFRLRASLPLCASAFLCSGIRKNAETQRGREARRKNRKGAEELNRCSQPAGSPGRRRYRVALARPPWSPDMLDRCVPALVPVLLAAACRAPSEAPAAAREGVVLEQRLAQIFATDELTPRTFGPARWLEPGLYCTVEPSATLAGGQDVVWYEVGRDRRIVVKAEALVPEGATAPLAVDDYAFSPDGRRVLVFTNTRKVWRQNTRGDYWVLDLDGGRLAKLGGDAPEASLMFAKLSPDGTRAAYVHANDLWVQDLAGGAITRLTHDGSATTINGTSDWVYEEELDVRDEWRWSPDGRAIAYWHFDSSGVPLYTLVDTVRSLYPTLTTIPYPKAGQTNSAVTVRIVDASGAGEPVEVALPGDPREHYVARMEWIPGPHELLVQQLDRRQQRATAWRVDAATGKARELFTETSAAWIDVQEGWRWLPSGELLWTSERDGWRQAWAVVPEPGGAWRCLTPGAYDITGIAGMDEARGVLYVLASPADATARALYRVPLSGGSGGTATRVTPADWKGTHVYDVAPGGGHALHTASGLERPPFVELVSLPDHAPVAVLEKNAEVAARVAEFAVQPTEFFRLAIEPGLELDGWIMRPRKLDPSKRYPLLMHVYNEPSLVYAQDVWRGVRGLFHRALAEAGWVIACVDTQGTPGPRGAAWRKSTYGRFGTVGAEQQAAAVRALCARHRYLDPERVAVWGWSGGGTMTLNLMFREPETYAVGMAVAPVPDLALYDSIYQERYTGLPATDAAAYRENSPITWAEGLAGDLLVMHGSGDDNVHMQGTERLIDRLVALGKPFEFMLYPNRSHAINEGPGTLHHVYAHLARYLTEHLPPGPR